MVKRPAETTTASVGLAALVWALIEGNQQAALTAAVAAIPHVVTFLVTHGGVRGVLRTLWAGRQRER